MALRNRIQTLESLRAARDSEELRKQCEGRPEEEIAFFLSTATSQRRYGG